MPPEYGNLDRKRANRRYDPINRTVRPNNPTNNPPNNPKTIEHEDAYSERNSRTKYQLENQKCRDQRERRTDNAGTRAIAGSGRCAARSRRRANPTASGTAPSARRSRTRIVIRRQSRARYGFSLEVLGILSTDRSGNRAGAADDRAFSRTRMDRRHPCIRCQNGGGALTDGRRDDGFVGLVIWRRPERAR